MIPRRDLLEIVSQDILYVRREWDEDIDDASLRRGSTVLRRLLVENELQRAWRAVGLDGQPMITTPAFSSTLESIALEKLVFATAGGARYKGAQLSGIYLELTNEIHEAKIEKLREGGPPLEAMSLTQFVDGTCVVVSGQVVSRRLLIKYISNKLGGAHYDPKRSLDEPVFSLLDSARERIQILDKPAVYFELLSIGQALAITPDIGKFLSVVEKTVLT